MLVPMDFRVLGPLTVQDGNRAVRLGGYRQQLVLAVLLLHANRELSTDWLIDAVWGEEPPRTARKTLQAYVSRLRSSLGRGTIVATPFGYTLRASAECLDSVQFEGLAMRGRQLLEESPAAACDSLSRALALWRGMPFGELGSEASLQPETQRLLELRLVATEDRIDADLASGNGHGLIAELGQLVEEYPLRERLRGQLMLGLYRSGRQADALRAYQATRHILGEELGIEPSRQLQELEDQILQQDPTIDGPAVQPTATGSIAVRNPYKGLLSFGEGDAEDFFGRDELVDELERRVHQEPFVAVVGASGCGKSSAVFAGLLPRLRSADDDRWVLIDMVPGKRPFAEFARAMHQKTEDRRGDGLDVLRAVQIAVPANGSRMLLVIDQFEELFHDDVDANERSWFVHNLVEAVEDPCSNLTVVATLRADFFGQAISQARLGPLIAAGTLSVVPLTAAELEEAAIRPAERVGVRFEPELIAELSSDMAGQPAALPLFEYVLTQLFEERSGSQLTRSDYRTVGGLSGALTRRAEEVFTGLNVAEQDIARQVFLRSAALGAGHRDVRRRINRDELDELGFDPANLEATLRAFDETRLLSFDRNPTTGRSTVEVAHEALFREWPRLRSWIHDAREDLRVHAILAAQALEWETSQRDASYLLTGSRLERYEDWPDDSSISFTTLERALVAESTARRDAQLAAEEIRRNQELLVERQSVRRLRWLVAAAALVVIVVGALSIVAVERGRVAAANEREARARELANAARNNVDEDADLAVLLALQATRATRSGGDEVLREAEEALHLAVNAQRLLARGEGEWSVVFSPSGDLLVGGETVRSIDPTTGSTLREYAGTTGSGDEWSAAVSPDGTLVAAAGPNLTIVSADTGDLILREYLDGPVFEVAFSPDGQTVATLAGYSGGLQVFRIADGALLAQHADRTGWPKEFCCPATDLVFSPDGNHVAATTWTGEVWIVETATGDRAATLTGHDGPVTGVAYVDDGRTIVTSSFDGSVRFWDVATQQQRSSFDAGVGQVVSLGVSPDESQILAGGDGGAVNLWTTSSGGWRLRENLRPGHPAFVLNAAFDASGQLGATVGLQDRVLVWDVTPTGQGEVAAWAAGRPVAFSDDGAHIATTGPDGRSIVVRHTADWQAAIEVTDQVAERTERTTPWGHVGGIALSPAMDLVAAATAGDDDVGSVKIWSARTGELAHTLLEGAFVKGSLDFSDDGRLLAAAVCNRPGPTAHVWNTTTGDVVFTTPPGDCGQAVDLDPTGRLLAVQTLDEAPESVQIWELTSGEQVAALAHPPAWLGAVRFSPDGSQLLTGGADGTVRIWEMESGSLTRVLTGHTGAVEDASWSADGSAILSGSHDGTVRMWDAATGETLLVLEGHDSFPFVEPSPGGAHVATATAGAVRIWTLDLDELTTIAQRRVPRSLTTAECLTYHFAECPAAP